MDAGNVEVKRIKIHIWLAGLGKHGNHRATHWHGSTEGTVPRWGCWYLLG